MWHAIITKQRLVTVTGPVDYNGPYMQAIYIADTDLLPQSSGPFADVILSTEKISAGSRPSRLTHNNAQWQPCTLYTTRLNNIIQKAKKIHQTPTNSEWASEWAQSVYIVPLMIDIDSRWKIQDSSRQIKNRHYKIKDNPEKAYNTKHSKTKLAWFSSFLQHSATKRGGCLSPLRGQQTQSYKALIDHCSGII